MSILVKLKLTENVNILIILVASIKEILPHNAV